MSDQAAEPTGDNTAVPRVEASVSAQSNAVEPSAAPAQGLVSEFSFADADKVVGATEAAATPPTDAATEVSAAPKTEIDAEPLRLEDAKPEAASIPGKVIVMSPRDRGTTSAPHVAGEAVPSMRRAAAFATVAALAAVAGALGGAMATATYLQGGGPANAAQEGQVSQVSQIGEGALQAQLARIEADMQALRAGLDHSSKLGLNQFNKTSDRLDTLERVQAEPAAKLAKLSDAVDRQLHALPVPQPAVAAATSVPKDVTGSIGPAPAPQQVAAVAVPKSDAKGDIKADAKTEVGRLPTLDDWVLRDVAYGGALINGRRRGVYEVYAGDFIPGLGRIDAIRRQDGRWVVVTSKGLIVAR